MRATSYLETLDENQKRDDSFDQLPFKKPMPVLKKVNTASQPTIDTAS